MHVLSGKNMAEVGHGLVLKQCGYIFVEHLDYLKCSPHKPDFSPTVLVDNLKR